MNTPNNGFTLIEMLLVVAVFVLLLSASVFSFRQFQQTSILENTAREAAAVVELAKNKTLASESDTRYGVHFDTVPTPHEYVLFQTDTDYASRVAAEDIVYPLDSAVQIDSIALDGGGQDIIFDRVEGTTAHFGQIVFSLAADPAETSAVFVEASGKIELAASAAPSDSNRIADTRHVHVAYEGRAINTATENIVLDFDSGVLIYTIVIADNLSGGQIVWEDTITVAGEDQTLKIHTHQLNAGPLSDETQFSVHRDRRFNTKRVHIKIDVDAGKLIEYDGVPNNGDLITGGESVYVITTTPQ